MRATAAWEPQVPGTSHLFLATASKPVPFQGTLTQQPSSLELELPQQGLLAPGLEVGLCLGPSSLLCQEPFSETVALVGHGLGPLKGHGALLLDGGVAHILHDVKELFPPPIVLSPVSALYVPFPVTPQPAWEKWWAHGFTEGKQINIVLLRKKKQSPR